MAGLDPERARFRLAAVVLDCARFLLRLAAGVFFFDFDVARGVRDFDFFAAFLVVAITLLLTKKDYGEALLITLASLGRTQLVISLLVRDSKKPGR